MIIDFLAETAALLVEKIMIGLGYWAKAKIVLVSKEQTLKDDETTNEAAKTPDEKAKIVDKLNRDSF